MTYRHTRYFHSLIIFFICILLLSITFSEAKEKQINSCQNLGKVNDIDELLFQFYSNVDNQCLFEISTEELEKIWGIKVLNYISSSDVEKNILNTKFSDLIDNEDSIFVRKVNFEHGIHALEIYITNKYREENNGWGGSIGRGQFPKLLPPPLVITDEQAVEMLYRRPPMDYFIDLTDKDTVYKSFSKYIWMNKSQSNKNPVLLFTTGVFPRPMNMSLYSEARVLDFE